MLNKSYSRPLALITGAYGGIGLACARRLGRNHDLILTDLEQERLNEAAQTLKEEGCTVSGTVAGDITDSATVGALCTAIQEAGPLHALIHSAALSPALAGWRDIMRVNVVGTDLLLREMKSLLSEGSVTVMIASMCAHLMPVNAFKLELFSNPQSEEFLDSIEACLPVSPVEPVDKEGPAYTLSKWWMLRTCEALAQSWGEKQARIVTVSPSLTWTSMGRKEAEDERASAFMASAPLPRWGTAMEIVDAVEFLVSDRASFITGSDIQVDGGVIGKIRASGWA